jgi:ElaA protein
MLRWRFSPFDELTVREVHDLYRARVGVFIVEQSCPFQDVDGVDPVSWHLLGRSGDGDGPLLAYCRLIPPGVKYTEPSIGRVLTTKEGRASGAGRELMEEAISRAEALWPGHTLRIGAQQYLEKFYGSLGFARASAPYDEDGIMHIEMVREPGKDGKRDG